jgi:glycosyltransferase involved in cell wall biosynthesis
LDLLLQAMADERVKQLGIRAIVAGEFYEDEKPYLEFIRANNLEQSIILKTEYIHPEQVRYYFCAADMIVQPYKTATQSGVTQIAYHFERPMLVTNVGGLPETVPDKKVGYVTGINATAIADAIIDFYTHQREQQFTANTVTEKQRFLWSTFVEGIQNLYSGLGSASSLKK